jgi:hypothetical protein
MERSAAIRAIVMNGTSGPATESRFGGRWQAAGLLAVFAVAVGFVAVQFWTRPSVTWAATPEVLDAATTTQLARDCAQKIAERHFPVAVLTAQPIIGEGRGDSTAVISAAAGQAQLCLNSTSRNFVGVYDLVPLPAGAIGAVDAVPGNREGGEALRMVFGRLAVPALGVTVTTADGRVVTASVADGYFFAWWPSHADAAAVTVALQSGATQALAVPDQTAPDPGQSSPS